MPDLLRNYWLLKVKKVKCTLVQALRPCTGRTAHRGSRGIALPFHEHGTRRGWGVSITPRPLFTRGKTRYPLYRRLGGPQGLCEQVRKISPPPGLDPRTVQPVASRYTDYATRPTASQEGPRNKTRYSEKHLSNWVRWNSSAHLAQVGGVLAPSWRITDPLPNRLRF